MEQFFNLIWSGVWLGCAYGFVGLGLIASFRSARVIDLSIGASFVFSAMFMAWLVSVGVQIELAVLIAVVAAIAISLLQERFILRPMVGSSPIVLLLGTLSVAIVLSGVCAAWFGRDPTTSPGLGRSLHVALGFWRTDLNTLFLVISCLALGILGWVWFERTITGRAVTAAGVDPGAAQMLGIDIWRLRLIAMGFAGLVTGLGGALFIPIGVLDFSQGLSFTLFGFVAAAVAGYESPLRTVLVSLAFGIVSELGTAYISSVFSQAVAFGILAIAILIGQRFAFLRMM